MLGVDYVPEAIELAKKIAVNEGREDVEFNVWDCVGGNYEDALDEEEGQKKEWDVVLDKGTFDAIGLAEDGRQAEQGYLERAKKLVKKDGLVVITSCNWTEEELIEKFTKGGELVVEGKVNYPTFQFGGKQGQTISTIAFKRL
jgi:EEF1A lysine methyltransferase 2